MMKLRNVVNTRTMDMLLLIHVIHLIMDSRRWYSNAIKTEILLIGRI